MQQDLVILREAEDLLLVPVASRTIPSEIKGIYRPTLETPAPPPDYHHCIAIIHISEAEATRDFSALLARVRAGEEVRVDDGATTIAVVRPPEPPTKPRTLPEAIRLAEQRDSQVTLDDQFGHDLEEVIRQHEHETLRDPWE